MHWVKAITFDFWGTLVDVDASGKQGMAAVLEQVNLIGLDMMEMYVRWDCATVRRYRSGPWRPYLEWGTLGLKDVLQPLGISQSDARWTELAELLISTMTSQAKPHPEAPAIIASLKEKFPLMPITNMDNRLFEMNPFKAEFDLFLTAQDAGAFKPSAVIFQKAVEKLGVPANTILHVSLSQFADLEGAMPVGLNVAWINRGGEELGALTPKPMYEFPNLKGLAELFALKL